jgi:hypothetical protein
MRKWINGEKAGQYIVGFQNLITHFWKKVRVGIDIIPKLIGGKDAGRICTETIADRPSVTSVGSSKSRIGTISSFLLRLQQCARQIHSLSLAAFYSSPICNPAKSARSRQTQLAHESGRKWHLEISISIVMRTESRWGECVCCRFFIGHTDESWSEECWRFIKMEDLSIEIHIFLLLWIWVMLLWVNYANFET